MCKRTKEYLHRVYQSRFFWMHLARIELKNKFRRSKLGILWAFVSPLCLTIIMSVIFAVAFHQNVFTYAPYVLSGLLVWDVFTQGFVGACGTLIANDPFIRQFNHPITIYSLKSAIVITISFLLSMVSLIVWSLFSNIAYVPIGLLSLPLSTVFMFAIAWSAATISSYTCTKFRDYPQMMALIMQALWYVSPVFLQESVFRGNVYLRMWFAMNPITHVLNLIRKPFLEGVFPYWYDYLVSFIFAGVLALLAVSINRKNEKDIIFYI